MTIRSLYLHYPFCRHLCNYCDFYKNIPKNDAAVDEFENLLDGMLVKHIDFLESHQQFLSPLETFFIGGGTPSLWGKEEAFF